MSVYPVTQVHWGWVRVNFKPSHFSGNDRPVERVSWAGCQPFCDRMRGLTGKPIRLPTEAEWEYACRAGTTTEYYSGDTEADLDKVAWYSGNSDKQTHPVGQKTPNAWGLYDMHGNVDEWCADWYDESYYRNSEELNPECREKTGRRVQRGGSWAYGHMSSRAATRWGNGPNYCSNFIGFRVCFHPD